MHACEQETCLTRCSSLFQLPQGLWGMMQPSDSTEERVTVLLAQLHVQSELLPRQGLPWVPPLTLVTW